MEAIIRRAALLGLTVVCVGCTDLERPAQPSPSPISQLTGPATTYSFNAPLDYRVRSFTERSSFVLHEDGGFYLRYESFTHVYQGRYEHDDGKISFYFGWDQRSATPDAVGFLKDNLLEVRYREIMQHADFENAVYHRVD